MEGEERGILHRCVKQTASKAPLCQGCSHHLFPNWMENDSLANLICLPALRSWLERGWNEEGLREHWLKRQYLPALCPPSQTMGWLSSFHKCHGRLFSASTSYASKLKYVSLPLEVEIALYKQSQNLLRHSWEAEHQYDGGHLCAAATWATASTRDHALLLLFVYTPWH